MLLVLDQVLHAIKFYSQFICSISTPIAISWPRIDFISRSSRDVEMHCLLQKFLILAYERLKQRGTVVFPDA